MSTTTVALIATVAVVIWLLERRGVFAEKAVDRDLLVLEQLRNAGSDLAKPHSPEFFLYFPQEGPARGACQALAAQCGVVRTQRFVRHDGPQTGRLVGVEPKPRPPQLNPRLARNRMTE
jgi:hypothetical protein